MGEVSTWYENKCCETKCYNITECANCIFVGNDEFRNGRIIKDEPVGNIPYESTSPYYVLIDQMAISKKIYDFWNSLKNQTNNVGGIFDTTPGTILSNLYNPKDSNDKPLGYFQVSGVTQKAIYINRGGQPKQPIPRQIKEESFVQAECQPCEAKENHTTIIPPNWLGK